MTRQRRWQIKHEEMGLCHVCPEPAAPGMLRCLKHSVAQREKGRARVGSVERYNSKSYRMEKQTT